MDLEIFDVLRQIVAGVEVIEQNHGRHLNDVDSKLKDKHDSFWDDLHERIDDLEQLDLSWNPRIIKKVKWSVKKIVQKRRQIAEINEGFAEIGNVSFCFPRKMDRSDIEVVEYLIEVGEIAGCEEVEDLQLHTVMDLGLCVENSIDGYVVHDKEMNFGNAVVGFRDIVDMDLHYVADMHEDIHTITTMGMNVPTDIELSFHVVDLIIPDVIKDLDALHDENEDVISDVIIDLNSYIVAEIMEDMDDATDLDFMMEDMTEDLHLSFIMDFGLHVTDLDSKIHDNVMASCDQSQRLLVMSYIQFIPENEYDWLDTILIFEWIKRRWLIYRFVTLSERKWKHLVKMKFGEDNHFEVKVWDILFYLPGESDAGASKTFSIYPGSQMQEHPSPSDIMFILPVDVELQSSPSSSQFSIDRAFLYMSNDSGGRVVISTELLPSHYGCRVTESLWMPSYRDPMDAKFGY